ncbi:hypothetical protein MUK42_33047 [Musa troglodytarum]|uniref:Uncharacterized protein n=1 Tax=Musa troglodytarum TaxID=320322 RepID=A0A9E7I909_9LILI|nr:hypothetical protein MUK42_33047 [Musa troglodytarum]
MSIAITRVFLPFAGAQLASRRRSTAGSLEMHRKSLSYAAAIFVAVNRRSALLLATSPFFDRTCFPSFMILCRDSFSDSTVGKNV